MEDFDFDGNDNVHTWDVHRCLDCGMTFNINTNDPYKFDMLEPE